MNNDPLRYALIGEYISHSRSPVMHNAGFKAIQWPGMYELRDVPKTELVNVLDELKSEQLAGANVTIPYKQAFLNELLLDERAFKAKAVNTIYRNSQRVLCGTNTDILGVREPLLQLQPHYNNAQALILGAGGAASAALIACTDLGMQCSIAARNMGKAEALLQELNLAARVLPLYDVDTLRDVFHQFDVVIQATPIGRNGETLELPWHLSPPMQIAFEMLYVPMLTPFLKDAIKHGARPIYGWQMLLEQGVAAFQYFTNQNAPKEVMKQALLHDITYP